MGVLQGRTLRAGDLPICTLEHVLRSCHRQPEHKTLALDDGPAVPDTQGLRRRRPIESAPAITGADRYLGIEGTRTGRWDTLSFQSSGRSFARIDSEWEASGQVHETPGMRRWIRTWGEVLDENSYLPRIMQGALDHIPDEDQSIQYLMESHAMHPTGELQSPDEA